MENLEEFHSKRLPFYIHPETLLIRLPAVKYRDKNHVEWFNSEGITYLHTIRGYYYPEDNYVMLYTNDFEIPDMVIKVLPYIFEYFNCNWIGLGCNKGKVGEIWKPKLKVYRNEIDSEN